MSAECNVGQVPGIGMADMLIAGNVLDVAVGDRRTQIAFNTLVNPALRVDLNSSCFAE
ncbi:hypothetical protein QNM99_26300 [Pseudomonas sp. PCH446]